MECGHDRQGDDEGDRVGKGVRNLDVPEQALEGRSESRLGQCAEGRPVSIVTDSAYDRWALAALLGREDLPIGVTWQRVPVAYEQIDAIAAESGLRRHHALDDARTLQCAVADLG